MRLPSRFSLRRFNQGSSSGRGCEGLQDRCLPAQKKDSRIFVSRHENLRDIANIVQVRDIVIAVSVASNIPTGVLLSDKRLSKLTRWRSLIYLLAMDLTFQSSTDIGHALNRDHTTILGGSKRCIKQMNDDRELADAYASITDELKYAVH